MEITGRNRSYNRAFKVFNKQDRDAGRALIKHANAVQALERDTGLERAVDKALGESVYKSQQALIQHMHSKGIICNKCGWPKSKKRSNKDKIRDIKSNIRNSVTRLRTPSPA